jgi:hypothetical protein
MANLRLEQHAGTRVGQVDVPSYISGYVDGEGCFTVSISPHPTLLVGWEVRPSLSVSQNYDRSEVLYEIQRYFECGSIRPDRSDRTLKWEIRSLRPLMEKVIPHFETYPMLSGKQHDFLAFADICRRMSVKQHCNPDGLHQIVQLAAGMNPSGKRGYEPASILRSLKRG